MLVIFDCDGVLVDSEMIASRVLAEAVSELGHPLTAAQCRARFTGKSLASVFEELSQDIDLPADFTQTLRARDVAAFEADLTAIDGVAGVLEQLRAKDIPVCVASSGRLEKIRHSLGLTDLLDFLEPHLFSAEMVKNGKPAPDLFELAAREMGMAPGQCTVIEDSEAGVIGAKAAGMRVFGFTGGSHCTDQTAEALRCAGADAVFSTMANLPGLL